MAEGLSEASDAFRDAIGSGSGTSLPRDESGRFTAVQARPEPIFNNREMEGDLSNDAGDDPRLVDLERKIADGRADERDKDEFERLSNDPKRARPADGDERHARTEKEQAGPDKPGEPDQDAEERDEGAGAEGTSEQDAEAARWALTLDGKPIEKVELEVGGEKKEVSLQEVMRGYRDAEAQRLREEGFAHQAREWQNATQVAAQEIGNTRNEYLKRLEYANRLIADLTPKEPDWDALYARDPQEAHRQQKVHDHVKGRMQEIARQMLEEDQQRGQYQAQTAQQAQAQKAQYTEWGKREFIKRAGIKDEATWANETGAMRRAALDYGFVDQEIAEVIDPRMLMVLRDASKYRRMMADKPKPVPAERGRTLAPGAASRISSGSARNGIADALREQTRQGGSIDATAAVFHRLLR